MIQFNSVEEGVSNDLKATLKQCITDNLVKIYEGTFCQEVQDSLHS